MLSTLEPCSNTTYPHYSGPARCHRPLVEDDREKEEARLFKVMIAKEEDAVSAQDLKLPAEAKAICHYRDGKFLQVDEQTHFRLGDEVVILTHSKNIPTLQQRWQPNPTKND